MELIIALSLITLAIVILSHESKEINLTVNEVNRQLKKTNYNF